MHLLALDAQGLAAGRQNLHAGSGIQHLDRQGSSCLDDVLAVVEHEQHRLVFEGGDQTADRMLGADLRAERVSECARHQARVNDRRQIDQCGSVPMRFDQPPGDREGNRGLADSARSDDGDEAPVRQLGRDRSHDFGAVDHACHGRRQLRFLNGGLRGRERSRR